MKRIILLIACIATLSISGFSQPDTIKIGAYINSLYDLNLSEESFSVDLWMWYLYKNDSLDPLRTVDIINAKELNTSLDDIETKEGIIWAAQKYKAEIKSPWNIENFPFDKQYLKLQAEESIGDTSSLVFTVDKQNSAYDSAINISGWEIVDFSINSRPRTYNTTYGDPELSGESTYPLAEIIFVIQRDGWSLFIKLFTGVYVAFLISLMVFFIDPVDVDPRFGLSVGGLFAAVGNKYIVDSILPETTIFTLVDKVHDITFAYLFFSIALSVYSLYLYKKGKERLSKKIDVFSILFLSITFIAINIFIVYNAITNAS